MELLLKWNACIGPKSCAVKRIVEDCTVRLIEPAWARGIDCSIWQGRIDWQAVHASGISYAFARLSEAHEAVPHKVIVRRDAYGKRNWDEMAKLPDFRYGAYCFFRPDHSAKIQAEVFLATLEEYGHGYGTLPTVLDCEKHCGMSAGRVTKAAREWLDIVHAKTGVRPIFYTYSDFARWHLACELLSECPLFIANYGSDAVPVTDGWERADFWQYTRHGECPGITTRVDLSVFCGTPEELRLAYAA